MEYTHFSRVSPDNVVIYATQIENSFILDENGNVSIELGIQHLHETIPDSKNDQWIVCDPNSPNTFGNIGYLYLPEYGKFIQPKRYESWTLNTDDPENLYWQPPVPMPEDSSSIKKYVWVEELQRWVAAD